MKTRILFGDCVAVDYYELDDNGEMITPNKPTFEGTHDGFYLVEEWYDEHHLAFTRQFETFNEAKEYVGNIEETA